MLNNIIQKHKITINQACITDYYYSISLLRRMKDKRLWWGSTLTIIRLTKQTAHQCQFICSRAAL